MGAPKDNLANPRFRLMIERVITWLADPNGKS